MYKQAFLLNIKIYPFYNGLGDGKIIENLFAGIKHSTYGLNKTIENLLTAKGTKIDLLILLIFFIIISISINEIIVKKNKIFIFILLFLFLSPVRGINTFHGVHFWNVAMTICALYIDRLGIKLNYINKIFIYILLFLVIPSLINDMYKNLSTENSVSINPIETTIVNLTSNKEQIFMDNISLDSTYLIYKQRYPVNRNRFIVPWFMDMYEKETILDLIHSKPNVLVWKNNITVRLENIDKNIISSYKDFCIQFKIYVEKNYKQISPESMIWIKN
jgi:hypothetical protein